MEMRLDLQQDAQGAPSASAQAAAAPLHPGGSTAPPHPRAPRQWSSDPAIVAVAGSAWLGLSCVEVRSFGYLVHALEVALWAVEQSTSYEEALVLAVNLGNDADLVGAVAGQLTGALYGLGGIPARWLEPLA